MTDVPNVSEFVEREANSLRTFLTSRFERALLVLGDLTPPLRSLTHIMVVRESTSIHSPILGCSAYFTGFSQPVLSIISDDLMTAQALLKAAEPPSNAILGGHAAEPLLKAMEFADSQADCWMTRETEAFLDSDIVLLSRKDESKVQRLYCQAGTGFWTTAMLQFGQHYGIQDQKGELLAISGVSFILPEQSYAQVGNVATVARARCRGFGGRCVRATIGGLHRNGINRCGLFVDAGNENLCSWYQSLGFKVRGRYCFVKIKK